MTAHRGAMLLAEFVRRGVLGTDPAALMDLLDLCRLAGVDVMPTDHTDERHPLTDSFDRVCAERDRLAVELARTQSVLAEYEQRVAADREEYLRRVRELESLARGLVDRAGGLSELLTRFANKDPDASLDMAMLDQQPDAVPPGSRTGDAVERKAERRAGWTGVPVAKEAA